MARPEWIEVGRVTRPHGLHGEVRVVVDSDNPGRFATGSVLYARLSSSNVSTREGEHRTRLTVEGIRGAGGSPIVAFREIDTRAAAEGLRSHVLEVRSQELPSLGEDEFYPFDLEGLTVRDGKGTSLGVVTGVMDSRAHGLLQIDLQAGGRVLVPFVSAAVPRVSVEEGYVIVEPLFLEATGGAVVEERTGWNDRSGRDARRGRR